MTGNRFLDIGGVPSLQAASPLIDAPIRVVRSTAQPAHKALPFRKVSFLAAPRTGCAGSGRPDTSFVPRAACPGLFRPTWRRPEIE